MEHLKLIQGDGKSITDLDPPDRIVVKLREVLKKAESGQINIMGVTWRTTDGTWDMSFESTSVFQLMGALDFFKDRLMKEGLEREVKN